MSEGPPTTNYIGPLPDLPEPPEDLEPHEELAEEWPAPTDDEPYTLPPEGEPRFPDGEPPTTDPFWEPPIDFGGDDGPSSPTSPPGGGGGAGFPPGPVGFPPRPPGLPFAPPGGQRAHDRARRRRTAKRLWRRLWGGVLGLWIKVEHRRDQDIEIHVLADFKARTLVAGTLGLGLGAQVQKVMTNFLAEIPGSEGAAASLLRHWIDEVAACRRSLESLLDKMRPGPGAPPSDSSDFDAAASTLQKAQRRAGGV